LQKWRSEAEFNERKLKNTEDELKSAKAKISDLKEELEHQRKS
jgi:ribosome-interacting GTPase 1